MPARPGVAFVAVLGPGVAPLNGNPLLDNSPGELATFGAGLTPGA